MKRRLQPTAIAAENRRSAAAAHRRVRQGQAARAGDLSATFGDGGTVLSRNSPVRRDSVDWSVHAPDGTLLDCFFPFPAGLGQCDPKRKVNNTRANFDPLIVIVFASNRLFCSQRKLLNFVL